MSVKLGELFVAITAKGTNAAKQGITGVKGALVGAAESANEAKFKILAAVFAMERMTAFSRNLGASLSEFAGFTGMSAEQLQRWQWAGKQASVAAENMESSFKNVQKSMGEQLDFGKPVAGFSQFASKVQNLDTSKLRDTEYMMKKLQEYAQLEPDVTRANVVMQSFGLTEDVIAAMRQGAFTKERLAKAQIFSNKEIGVLQKMHATWGNIVHDFELGIGKMSTKFGPDFLDAINQISKAFLRLIEVLIKLTTEYKVFEKMASAIDKIADTANIFTGKSKNKLAKDIEEKGIAGNLFKVQEGGLVDRVGKFFENMSLPSSATSAIGQTGGGRNYVINNNTTVNNPQTPMEDISRKIGEWTKSAIFQTNQGEIN